MFYKSITKMYNDSQKRVNLQRHQMVEKYSYRMKRSESEMKILRKLSWKPRWVSHLGAVEGCLKFLKQKISTAWIYGGTGHAFIINVAKDLCPSDPTAWGTMMLYELAPNLVYKVDGVFARKSNPEFPRLQEKAWEHAKNCIDDGIPCYGWN